MPCRSLFTSLLLLAVVTVVAPPPSLLQAAEPADPPTHPLLPAGVTYDPTIPTPSAYLGFEIGKRHLHHHQMVGYLRALAAASARVSLTEYARSYGHRPLLLLTISSTKNQRQLESIRLRHLQLADPERASEVDLESLPAVINMGYSVHGNEPSGGNVAPLVAYHLAAATGPEHERLLDEVVILLDPCLNPDGFERFANWANNHRGRVANADPQHREHVEPWPSGRTNYYWFDLNRDWLPAQHPESQGRLAEYHRWKPNVVLDFHEMGTSSTYFFQPGVPARNHPLTPLGTFALTRQFARFHAKALDQVGSLYYTEERFDDFYMGKGSTYPDLHGAVGILFEQASSRGQVQQTRRGPLRFEFTIRNQWLTSFSSLDATQRLRRQLLEHKRDFYRDNLALARNGKQQGYLVSAGRDTARLHRFLEILQRHDISAVRLKAQVTRGNATFPAGSSFYIPARQPEYRFLQSLFETRSQFKENIFYDVSTWTLPLAFGLQVAAVDEPLSEKQLGEPFRGGPLPGTHWKPGRDDLAYVVDWQHYFAPRTLYRLLDSGIHVDVATQPFEIAESQRTLGYGSLLIPLGIQADRRKEIVALLEQATSEGVEVFATRTGLTPQGIDLGSSAFEAVPHPRLLLITGNGASSYEAGEVWHLLDRRFQIPVTMAETTRLSQTELDSYTAIVMVSGSYSNISAAATKRMQQWVQQGGTLIAIGTAARWVHSAKIATIPFRSTTAESATPPPVARRPYASAEEDAAFQLVRGSIFRTRVDSTHPLGYGFQKQQTLPVFRNNRVFLDPVANPYSTPVAYESAPLLSGYVSEENLRVIGGSASVVVRASGRGRVIVMADNPNFRGFWYGTNRLFLNAACFGPLVRVP